MDSINKNIELSEEFLQRKWYKKSVWKECRAFNIALNYLGKIDPKAKRKNKLWKKFLLVSESIDSKKYLKLQKYLSEQNSTINKAIQKMEQLQKNKFYETNQIFRKSKNLAPIGVYAYELQ